MRKRYLSDAVMHFPLKTGETVEVGKVYEIVSGVAQKITSSGITGNIVGVCMGGNNINVGKIMLDVDPTAVFEEGYSTKPTIGTFVDGCKLVVAVNEDNSTFEYILKIEPVEA